MEKAVAKGPHPANYPLIKANDEWFIYFTFQFIIAYLFFVIIFICFFFNYTASPMKVLTVQYSYYTIKFITILINYCKFQHFLKSQIVLNKHRVCPIMRIRDFFYEKCFVYLFYLSIIKLYNIDTDKRNNI